MKTITAVENTEKKEGEIWCFLAGGITNCPDWQAEVIANLELYDSQYPGELDGLVVLNPRRPNFPIGDSNAAREQITWEFERLQAMDVFSMYFTAGESDQPICMYELGRNLQRMQTSFPEDWTKRVVVSCDEGYRRAADVAIQTELAWNAAGGSDPWGESKLIGKADPMEHAYRIIRAYQNAKKATK